MKGPVVHAPCGSSLNFSFSAFLCGLGVNVFPNAEYAEQTRRLAESSSFVFCTLFAGVVLCPGDFHAEPQRTRSGSENVERKGWTTEHTEYTEKKTLLWRGLPTMPHFRPKGLLPLPRPAASSWYSFPSFCVGEDVNARGALEETNADTTKSDDPTESLTGRGWRIVGGYRTDDECPIMSARSVAGATSKTGRREIGPT